MSQRRELVDESEELSVRDQCELLGLSRSGYYYEASPETAENLEIMRRLDELHMMYPVYGSRRLGVMLAREGTRVNRKRVMRLLQTMGIEAIYPKGKGSEPGAGHRIYPYLLKGMEIEGPDWVWCSDITYVPLQTGYMYLVAVMDWWSRHVLAWEISNTLDSDFCIRAWERALGAGRRVPDIANTDQGSQFTSDAYLEAVESVGVTVSMDGKGRWMDNVFIERLWRSVKYECIYLHAYETGSEARAGIGRWVDHYNTRRPHSSLCGRTPAEVHEGFQKIDLAA